MGFINIQVGAVVQRVCAHVTGLPKAAEVVESPLDKMFGGISDKGRSLVALKEEAAERRRMLQRAAQEAGESQFALLDVCRDGGGKFWPNYSLA